MFIPTINSANPFDDAIYFTTSHLPPEQFLTIYANASKLALKGLYFIQYDASIPYDSWIKAELFPSKQNDTFQQQFFSIPSFKVFEYVTESNIFTQTTIGRISEHFTKTSGFLEQKKIPIRLVEHFVVKFSQYSIETLTKLYVERLFFDGYLNLTYQRGAPLDIDTFIIGKDGKLRLLEIKEKDVSKREPRGFGMDLRRIESLSTLSNIFSTQAFYVVRHVNNQTERKFVGWKFIELETFKRHIEFNPTVEGGTGMRSINSQNPTKVCSLDYFNELN